MELNQAKLIENDLFVGMNHLVEPCLILTCFLVEPHSHQMKLHLHQGLIRYHVQQVFLLQILQVLAEILQEFQ